MSNLYRSVLAGAVAGLTVLSLASPASARRIAFDIDEIVPITPCTLGGGACSGFDLPFPIVTPGETFSKIFVYDAGVVSLGSPLPATASVAGGPASLGSSYIATGFADYTGDVPNVYLTYADLNFRDENFDPFVGEFRVTWAYPEDDKPIWDISFVDLSVVGVGLPKDPARIGDVEALIGHGSDFAGWTHGFDVQLEPFLPNGAVVGWNVAGQQASTVIGPGFDLDGADFRVDFSSVIPEPATWAMMILGFGLVGSVLRRRPIARTC